MRKPVLVPGIVDKEDVKRILEMNSRIVQVNCELLIMLSHPMIIDKELFDADDRINKMCDKILNK